ncbi:unnamed protein product [Triticum turgidum subsp. durum]|uniref:3'-5' exonuclease domain-containing protein n=1 Tax=Triticum turgidum subsp. durum TaxID=4567 RepID=A0A9R0T229_TRITD|nr:unnamed protein product [Triticum turgidum subsp. durum]
MAEEPSTKRHHGEMSDKSCDLDDVHIPGEKRMYTRTLEGVELHGKETLEIVCTSEPDKADEMITKLRRKAGGSHRKIVGLGLCMEEFCLVYHIATATKWTKRLNEMLKHEKLFTFVGFSIERDKEKMKISGLPMINPNKYVDIQRFWRVPYTGKEYDSLTDVAASIIHPFYKGMKKNIDTQEDHKLWMISPLPDKLIEYAGKDAYATYKSWNMIDNITNGREMAKVREVDHYNDRPFRPF